MYHQSRPEHHRLRRQTVVIPQTNVLKVLSVWRYAVSMESNLVLAGSTGPMAFTKNYVGQWIEFSPTAFKFAAWTSPGT